MKINCGGRLKRATVAPTSVHKTRKAHENCGARAAGVIRDRLPHPTQIDELSYCLHIVLRFELELALLEQEMPVEELPQQWNQRMLAWRAEAQGAQAGGRCRD